ncbi:hypothetical protein [Salininema proteolyticum]|uniref:Uncharacterized protein n=1 Tax=Salininema proteolyticum TaxID=1607685 RepID=A0ABV8TVV9_9ACTN
MVESGFSAEENGFAAGAIIQNSDPELYALVSFEWDMENDAGERVSGSQSQWGYTQITIGPDEERTVGIGGDVTHDFDASEVEDVGVPVTILDWYSEEPDTYTDLNSDGFQISECGNPGHGKVQCRLSGSDVEPGLPLTGSVVWWGENGILGGAQIALAGQTSPGEFWQYVEVHVPDELADEFLSAEAKEFHLG